MKNSRNITKLQKYRIDLYGDGRRVLQAFSSCMDGAERTAMAWAVGGKVAKVYKVRGGSYDFLRLYDSAD